MYIHEPELSFREFAAKRSIRSPRTQKEKCRTFQELSIGSKQVEIWIISDRLFFAKWLNKENRKQSNWK